MERLCILENYAERSVESIDDLTPRLRETLMLIAEGMTNREIADEMGIAEQTVKHYARHIYHVLGLSVESGSSCNRVRAARWYWSVTGKLAA